MSIRHPATRAAASQTPIDSVRRLKLSMLAVLAPMHTYVHRWSQSRARRLRDRGSASKTTSMTVLALSLTCSRQLILRAVVHPPLPFLSILKRTDSRLDASSSHFFWSLLRPQQCHKM